MKKGREEGGKADCPAALPRSPIGLQNFTESFTNRIVVLTLCKSGINIV